MKHRLLFILLFVTTIGWTTAQIPDGYYDAAVGKSGEELRTALYDIIKTHTAVSYNDLWNSYRATDVMPSGKVWDIYSDVPDGTAAYYYDFGTDQCGSYTREGDCYNREHSIPQSWFGEEATMRTDLFHLYPTDGWVNNKRGNLPYGMVSSATWTSTNGSKLGPCGYPGCSGTVFEPIDAYKGDLARSYFYMTVCYKNKNLGQTPESMFSGSQLLGWAQQMLVEWHNADPVSEKEVNRNRVIYSQIQHNRNPFIDCPELVDYLFGSRVGEAWYPTCFEWEPDTTEITDTTGITDTTDITDTTGIISDNFLANIPSYRLYPNPATDNVTVESAGGVISSVELYDVMGRLLLRRENVGASSCTFDVNILKSGYYFVRITADTSSSVLMLVRK